MKIAITGARGTLGRTVVQICSKANHQTIQVNRTDQEYDGTPNSEMRTADVANNYEDTLEAFKGCDAVIHLAAISNPVVKEDAKVHNNNVNSAFNGFQAPEKPTYAYALAKQEAEAQAKAFVNWFPGMSIACMGIHQVEPRETVWKEHEEQWDNSAVKQLWGWVNPEAAARACLLAVGKSEAINGFGIFNIIAPTTTQDTPSRELARKYFPNAEIRGDLHRDSSILDFRSSETGSWLNTSRTGISMIDISDI